MEIIGYRISVIMAVLFMAGCASTTLTGVWSDENYKNKPIQSVMVIGVFNTSPDRNIFETEMSAALEKAGVKAIASTKLLGNQEITKENVLQAAIENNIQAVLVTQLVGIKKEEVYHPPVRHGVPVDYYRTWDGYYPHLHSAYSPGYMATYTNVILETSVFAVKEASLIWSASSETFEPSNVNKEIKQLSRILVSKMKEGKLVK